MQEAAFLPLWVAARLGTIVELWNYVPERG